jgi:hypothetical protein
VLALFPDHEVELNENVWHRDTTDVEKFDLVIVDAAALREVNTHGAQWSRTVQGWKIPTIWIEDAAGAQAPTGKQLVVLGRPLQRDALQAALVKCLDTPSAKQNGTASAASKVGTGLSEMSMKETGAAPAPQVIGAPVIELVDVVEEEPERKSNKKQQRNTK